MKKKLLTLILAIATCGMMASAATKYEINVAGVEVTSDNCSRITGGDIKSGYAVYDASSNTLTCYGLKIYRTGQDNYGIHNRKCDNLKIVFSGSCDVECADNALKLERGTTLEALSGSNTTLYSSARIVVNLKSYSYTIQGSGQLRVESNQDGYEAIKGEGSSSTHVYFKGAKVTVESAKRSALSSFKADFYEGADLTIYSNGSNTSVSSVAMTFSGKETVLSPYGAYYSNSAIYSSSGSQVTSETIYISDDYVAIINSSNFPDANFRNAILNLYPKGYLTTSDVNSRTTLDVSAKSISSLTGISYFTEITQLNCSSNNLTDLYLVKLTKLNSLSCFSNKLTSINMPNSVQSLNCSSNQLASLNIPSSMEWLDCSNNQFASMSIPYSLVTLYCGNNKFTTLTINNKSYLKNLYAQNNTSMTELNCQNNGLTTLSVSGCTALKELNCWGNQLSSLGSLPNSLQEIYCGNNNFESLDVSNKTNLQTLSCPNNKLTSLNMSGCTALKNLICNNNQLTSLSTLPSAIQSINCSNNKFTTLTINGKSALKELNVSGNTSMTKLNCDNNALTSLNVSNCTAMTELTCKNNQLTNLDNLTTCTSLKMVYASFNRLGQLPSIPNSLHTLICDNNNLGFGMVISYSALQVLNVANNPSLPRLDCYHNALTTLNVSGCTALKELNCWGNQLTSLDVRGLKNLETLASSDNALTSLYVTDCSALKTLRVSYNKLASLSLQGCTALQELYIQKNQIKDSEMTSLIGSLRTIPTSENEGLLGVYEPNSSSAEGNQITDAQIIAARAKRWMPKQYTSGSWEDLPFILTGDVNGDGAVNVTDVTTLVNMILNVIPKDLERGDIDGNGAINVSDVTALVNIILGLG